MKIQNIRKFGGKNIYNKCDLQKVMFLRDKELVVSIKNVKTLTEKKSQGAWTELTEAQVTKDVLLSEYLISLVMKNTN